MINTLMQAVVKMWDVFVDKIDKKIIKFIIPTNKCNNCGIKTATWKNNITNIFSCDSCLPRGCSCRIYKKSKRAVFLIQNYEYKKNSKNEDLQCEDWDRI